MRDADQGRLRSGPSRRTRVLKLSVLLILGTLIYGATVPVRGIQLTHHETPLAWLAPELDSFRLVQLSDLHSSLLVGAG